MKIGVISQTRPWAVFLRCVCDAVFVPFGKIVPRVVSSNGEEGPISAFQVLHQYISSRWCRLPRLAIHQAFFPIAPDDLEQGDSRTRRKLSRTFWTLSPCRCPWRA